MFLKRLLAVLTAVLITAAVTAQTRLNVTSPDNNLSLNFWIADGGVPMYELSYKNKPVILPSAMGLEMKETYSFEQLPNLRSNLMIMDSKQSASDSKWKPVWGM